MTYFAKCYVCGFQESEVERMHYFPSSLEKSRLWQESMGIICAGESLRNYRICSRHFTDNSYVDLNTRRLRRDAVPTLYPAILTSAVTNQLETIIATHIESTDETVGLEPQPGCSTELDAGLSTPKRQSLFRGIENLSVGNTSPRKKSLINLLYKKEDHIRKLKQLCKKKSTNIKALSDLSDSDVVKNLFKDMSVSTTNFLLSQLRCAKRSPRGRRWTIDEKIVALCLFKRSPKCYALLRKLVALPAKQTLLALLHKIPFSAGINEHLFKHIDSCISNDIDRTCVLLFDEMDIMENIVFDSNADRITGLEDYGEERKSTKFANKVLVFMCQGLAHKWKQPVAYYFSHDGVRSEKLKTCIDEVIKAGIDIAKLNIVATICDMGSSNVRALKEMGSTIEKPFFKLREDKIYTMYDPPHLLKCTVALFRKHSVFLPVSFGDQETLLEAKFDDIKVAHEIDKKSPLVFRSMHKIKDSHLAPVMRFAMKVNLAAQVMSRTVAAFLYTLLSRGELEQRSLATATFIHQVDELFDSFNGNRVTAPDGKQIKCCVSDNSPHLNFWKKSLHNVKSWHFRRVTKLGNLRTGKPPSQVGWMVSIKAIQGVWKSVKSKGLESLYPRSLNQDSLENLFGAIRAGCGCGDNPTASQFIASLKTQILNGLANKALSGTNCEKDENIILSNLRNFLTVEDEPTEVGPNIVDQETHIPFTVASDIANESNWLGSTGTLSVAYVSGFIAKSILKDIKCLVCKQNLCSESSEDIFNQFIVYKEWSEQTSRLTYPTENLVVTVGCAITILESLLDKISFKKKIEILLSQHISEKVNFSWLNCSEHQHIVKKSIIKGITRIGIPWWCRRKNVENKKEKKDARASKRKLKKFKHV